MFPWYLTTATSKLSIDFDVSSSSTSSTTTNFIATVLKKLQGRCLTAIKKLQIKLKELNLRQYMSAAFCVPKIRRQSADPKMLRISVRERSRPQSLYHVSLTDLRHCFCICTGMQSATGFRQDPLWELRLHTWTQRPTFKGRGGKVCKGRWQVKREKREGKRG